jgi:ectoine hydroxylase-related dioxygenase (phytanoyl-CoA dioxygenase family)
MLTQQQLDFFTQNGFVKGSVVLCDAEVETLRAETLRVIDQHQNGTLGEKRPVQIANVTGDAENALWQIVNVWEGSPAFDTLTVHNSALIEEVAQIMQREMGAREIRLFHDQIAYKPAQKGAVNMWHQDSPYWPVLQPKDVQLTAWIALDDADEENGCMSMVPGSQEWGNQSAFLNTIRDFRATPSEFKGHEVQIVPCPVEKGAVHYHHPLTWHGSPQNRSGRPRRAIALHFMTERAVFDPKGLHPMGQFITMEGGQKVEGEHFPLVWEAA